MGYDFAITRAENFSRQNHKCTFCYSCLDALLQLKTNFLVRKCSHADCCCVYPLRKRVFSMHLSTICDKLKGLNFCMSDISKDAGRESGEK